MNLGDMMTDVVGLKSGFDALAAKQRAADRTPLDATFLVDSTGRAVSYADFARRVEARARQLAAWPRCVIGLWADHTPDFVVNLFAIWRVDAVPLLLSRRLPEEAVTRLLDASEASLLITPGAAPAGCSLPVVGLAWPELEAQAGADLGIALPAIGPATGGVAVILHTTGSTGLPKLVRIGCDRLDASLRLLHEHWGDTWRAGDASLGVLPLFHVFGLCAELLQCYRRRGRYLFGSPNPHDLVESLQHHRGDIARLCVVPWTLAQMAEIAGGFEALSAVRYVIVGGAPLAPALGDRLVAAGVRVVQGFGMTEAGTVFMSRIDAGDWRDMHPVIPPEHWHLEEDTQQLVLHAGGPTLCSANGADFPTGDLFERRADGSVRHVSRIDDVLVQANGEKTNALVMEQLLRTHLHPHVEHVCVTGAGRLRLACILLWRRTPSADDLAMLKRCLHTLNASVPRHSRLHDDLMLHLGPEQAGRLPLTAKKAVSRVAAVHEFSEELEALYRDRAAASTAAAAAVEDDVFDTLSAFDPRTSLFDQGFDSLDAVTLAFRFADRYPEHRVPTDLLFRHPTVNGLRGYFAGLVQPALMPPVFEPLPAVQPQARVAPARSDPSRVLLTGASGFIGRHLLQALLADPAVAHVQCPVRRRAEWMVDDARVAFHEGYDFLAPDMGLRKPLWRRLSRSTDTVVHAAWPVDFNATYEQLAPRARGSIQQLIDFCLAGRQSLHFLSSVSTVMRHPTKRRVDEEPPACTADTCVPMGYAQTKWEAEQLLLRSGVAHKIYRMTEITAHSLTGSWHDRDHMRILLAASAKLGRLPALPYAIDWVPVDVACQVLVELMKSPTANILHIAHPRPIDAALLGGGMLEAVPLAAWLASARPHLADWPWLAPIWPFLERLHSWSDRVSMLDAQATTALSPTLAGCPPIDERYLRTLFSALGSPPDLAVRGATAGSVAGLPTGRRGWSRLNGDPLHFSR